MRHKHKCSLIWYYLNVSFVSEIPKGIPLQMGFVAIN